MGSRAVLVLAGAMAFCGLVAAGPEVRKEAASTGPGPTASRPATASAPTTTSAPAIRAVHVFLSGTVQGVGFRDWTVGEARRLRLTGWVRNLDDGRVEAFIEGRATAVDEMLEKMKTGPSNARVDGRKITDETPAGRFKTFDRR
jgi:acylphosphatase